MSPTTPASPDNTRTVKRWNSILSSDHKRSQSLNGVHKFSSTDAARSTLSLGTLKSRDDEQSSIHTLSSATETIIEEDDFDQQESTSPARSVNSVQSFNTSPPPRPKPAPRLWQESVASPSLRGLETAIAPTHTIQEPTQIKSPSFVTSPVPASPIALVSKFSTWKEKSFAGRRKGSVPDLELAVRKPFSPDSPTLPPIQSARTPRSITTLGSITPKPYMNESVLADTNQYAALKTPEWHERDQKRASSMLIPSNQAPIVIPAMPSRMPPLPPIDTTIAVCKDEERPPRPPPKSPRTLLRAFPVPKSAILSGRHTASSSINSISPTETPSTAATTWSPASMQSTPAVPMASTFSKSPSRVPMASSYEEPALTIATQFQTSPSTMRHGRSASSPQTEQKLPKSSSQALSNHKRMTSDTSVMNRGRPTKRNSKRATMRAPKTGVINSQFEALPQGISKSQLSQIPIDELYGMRRDAEEVASDYYILTQKQIIALNQEKRSLDENCNQIQRTISGLKEVRKATYLSLKMYLDTPDNATSMRDYTTKQIKTLNNLDAQIDEWQDKLNAVSDRKLAIQSKVWEHMAAILAAVNANSELGRAEEHTPPRSPERGLRFAEDFIQEDTTMSDSASVTRGDVESITIYADSGVASLLRSIEEELDVIGQSRYRDEGEIMM